MLRHFKGGMMVSKLLTWLKRHQSGIWNRLYVILTFHQVLVLVDMRVANFWTSVLISVLVTVAYLHVQWPIWKLFKRSTEWPLPTWQEFLYGVSAPAFIMGTVVERFVQNLRISIPVTVACLCASWYILRFCKWLGCYLDQPEK